MGAAASIQGQQSLTEEEAKKLAGEFWSQEQWDKHASNGVLQRTKFKDVIRGADPNFIWALYDKDGSGAIQVSELTGLLADLGMGEGDVDLDAAVAEMEIDDADADMDGKMEKGEFMKWLAAKKAELADMDGGGEEESKQSVKVASTVVDANAWGDDPKHHAAATKIQAIARGRQSRKPEEGTIEVVDEGIEELQNQAALKIQAHARGRLARKQRKETSAGEEV